MYALLYRNREKGWKGPTSLRPGDRVFVPRYYAGKVTLWVDTKTRLPVAVRIYAHDGNLYERYEYHDLETNVGLKDPEFDPKNPAYDF
jgi:outer membrane lipoprotein-sorting protein